MQYTTEEIRALKKMAAQIRYDILEMIPPGKAGHLGGSSSIADVTTALYFKHMKVFSDPKNPLRDRCVFSKGHATLAQYACFAELGYFDREELKHVKTLHGTLQGHPDMEHTPGIEAVTGSLGQGLSVSLGMALGLRVDGSESRVYCVVGDGELDEGQIWEAAMAASAHKASFGWNVIEIDGHDFNQILAALDASKECKGKPTAIIANTIKGKGFAFAEGKAAFHNASMTEEQYALAHEMVEQMRKEAEA